MGVLRAKVNGQWVDVGVGTGVPVYTSTAARTAGNPTPVRGDGSYLASGNETEGLEFWDGAAWRKPWNMPWGRQALQTGQGQLTTTGGTELVLMTSPAFTGPGGRWYKITCDFTAYHTVASDVIRFTTRRGTTIAGTASKIGPGFQQDIANMMRPFTLVSYDAPAAGSLQWSVCVARMSGTGTFTFVSAGSYDNAIAVEDIGPVTAAVPS